MNSDFRHPEHIISPSLVTGGGQGGGSSLLIIRFSALGDVAMTVPVVKALALANPDVHITFVSRPFAKAFYEGLADNVEFVGFDLKAERYKGVLGLEHVYADLAALKPDMVADLHDVLRTKYARLRFRLAGIPVAHIDKNRKGRKEITRQENKILTPQPTSFDKYRAVFTKLGLKCPDLSGNREQGIGNRKQDSSFFILHSSFEPDSPFSILHFPFEPDSSFFILHSSFSIGIAPFAAHKGKIYPIEKMEQVIAQLTKAHPDLQILLFGGGKKEKEVFDGWCAKYNNVVFASAQCKNMREELAMMSQLRCMISMDSGNMHLASLVGTPVVSIWGATHPYAGFMGWGQSLDNAVHVDLPCRPCSIYGNKPCRYGSYPCLNNIQPEEIVKKVQAFI